MDYFSKITNLRRSINRLKSQAGGAELAVVLTAAAIGAIIVTNNAGIYTKLSQANRANVQGNVSLDIKNEIESFLAVQENCLQSFNNMTSDPNVVRTTDFIDTDGNIGFRVGPNAGYGSPPMFLVGWTLVDTSTIIEVSERTRVVDLNLRFLKSGQSPGGDVLLRTVKLSTQKSGTVDGPITSCFAIAGATDDLWTRNAAGNNINNTNGGNVGIGTISPIEKLHVVGASRISGHMDATDLASTGLITSTGDVLIRGNSALGHSTPTERLHIIGNSYMTGNQVVDGDLTTRDLQILGNHTVNGDASVVRNSNLGTLTVTGQTDMEGALTVGSTATFMAAVTAPMIGVGAVPNGVTRLAVQGNTQASAEIEATQMNATRFCIGGNCRTTFQPQVCAGAIMGINTNGTVQCANPTCAANQLFRGLTAGGAAICEDLPMNSCGPNEYMSQVNPVTGVRSCQSIPPHMQVADCPGASRITQIRGTASGGRVCTAPVFPGGACAPNTIARSLSTAGGAPTCTAPTTLQNCPSGKVRSVSASGVISCSNPFPAAAVRCPAGQVANGFNSDGSLRCTPTGNGGGLCPPDAVAIGRNINGTPRCGCAPVVASWFEGTRTCETTLPPTAVSTWVNRSGSTAYGSGTASFYCQSDGTWNLAASSPDCN